MWGCNNCGAGVDEQNMFGFDDGTVLCAECYHDRANTCGWCGIETDGPDLCDDCAAGNTPEED